MRTSIWFIGVQSGKQNGQNDDRKSTLTQCKWSLQSDMNVIKINRGWEFNIYTIALAKNQCIVPGFIRNAQNLFPYNSNSFYIIPGSIILLCTQYFGNYLLKFYGAGYNAHGQCGIDTNSSTISNLMPIKHIENVQKACIGISGWNVIWIRNDGNIYINGRNSKNQLGITTINPNGQKKPILLTYFAEKGLKIVENYKNISN